MPQKSQHSETDEALVKHVLVLGMAGPGGTAGDAEHWWRGCSAQQESIHNYI